MPTIGQHVVECTIEQYPQKKVFERIYQALRSWYEKCYSDNEHEMVQQFCVAYSGHASSRALWFCLHLTYTNAFINVVSFFDHTH
jgi:hypothetical protein